MYSSQYRLHSSSNVIAEGPNCSKRALQTRDAVEWDPLCTYLVLKEAIRGGLTLSSEELELAVTMHKARASELANARSQRHRSRKRAADPTLYK